MKQALKEAIEILERVLSHLREDSTIVNGIWLEGLDFPTGNYEAIIKIKIEAADKRSCTLQINMETNLSRLELN